MGDDGSGVRRVAGLHPTEEGQEGGRVLWYAVVGPRCELELTNLPLLTRAILERTERGGLDMVVELLCLERPTNWFYLSQQKFQACTVQTLRVKTKISLSLNISTAKSHQKTGWCLCPSYPPLYWFVQLMHIPTNKLDRVVR